MRRALALIISGLVLILVAMPVAATDNAKWFVCKYTGTPGVDEVLQTGDNPISVAESAIKISPVVPGAIFADGQGRSLVLVEDTGQPEPPARDDCPPTLPPPPSPTPSPSPSLSASPSSSPSPSPSVSPSATPTPTPSESPPGAVQFSVAVCPVDATATTDFLMGLTALDVPEGQSAIRFSVVNAAILITTLNVRIDSVLLTLENTLGDGTVGDRIVSPGTHTWSISTADDSEVLASGEVECPVCNAVSVPPLAPTPNTAMPVPQAMAFVFGVAFIMLGSLLLWNVRSVKRRKED